MYVFSMYWVGTVLDICDYISSALCDVHDVYCNNIISSNQQCFEPLFHAGDRLLDLLKINYSLRKKKVPHFSEYSSNAAYEFCFRHNEQ
jgi:hypothetical protein